MMDSLMTQPIQITDDELQIFKDVDDIVGKAVLIGDPLMAFDFGYNLRKKQAMQGLALAKLLYRLRESWDLFRAGGIDDDLIVMAHTQMGVSPETSRKYLRMWESIFVNDGISEDIKKILMGRPIGDLLLLTAAARDGSLDDDGLMQAALAPDRSALRDIIKDARGEQTSSSTAIRISIVMFNSQQHSKGTLIARRGDEMAVIGILNVDDNDDLAMKAIESLLNARGVKELYGQ